MHVAHIGFHVDPQHRAPARLLEDWPTLVDVAEAVQRAGVRVSVLQACGQTETITRNGVNYHFFEVDPRGPAAGCNGALESLLRRLQPDVLHVHGVCFPAEVAALAVRAPGIPILLQDHASRVPRIWRRRAWRRGFAAASGVAFCSVEQARPFATAGLIDQRMPIYEVPESSSHFTPGDQAEARRKTRLGGEPCLLWVGHLIPRKDPLTVLDGVSEAARRLPNLQLWCFFQTAPLLALVQRRIARDPLLQGRVHLLGAVTHDMVEQVMRAADIFVQGSCFEGSGYALLEALACGLPPVVTDIPSFRSLTGNGSVGRLWPCGDARSLSAALVDLAAQSRGPLRSAVRAHFDRAVSFDAVGQVLADTYRRIRDRYDRVPSPSALDGFRVPQ
jgi:glycosyltransferase involved in cell wall biosynthesis